MLWGMGHCMTCGCYVCSMLMFVGKKAKFDYSLIAQKHSVNAWPMRVCQCHLNFCSMQIVYSSPSWFFRVPFFLFSHGIGQIQTWKRQNNSIFYFICCRRAPPLRHSSCRSLASSPSFGNYFLFRSLPANLFDRKFSMDSIKAQSKKKIM